MNEYQLKPDEILLYEGAILRAGIKGYTTNLILTDKNIVFEMTEKKIFGKGNILVESFPITDIKQYNEEPQVKCKGSEVTIFLTESEEQITFAGKIEALKFTNKAVEAATGNKLSARGAQKVRGAIGVVDSALGIDTVNTVVNVLENGIGGTASKLLGGTMKKNKLMGGVLGAVSGLKREEESKESMPAKNTLSYEEQIETLKRFKELLYTGIISQEEFDKKKKEIMG